MKKSIKDLSYSLLLFFSLFACVALTACDDDDPKDDDGGDEKTLAEKLVGTWVADDPDFYWGYIFTSRGTYTGFECDAYWSGTYVIEGSTVIMFDEDGWDDTFVVKKITARYMVADFDGNECMLVKEVN